MQFKHHFKHVDSSDSLKSYLEALIEKQSRYLLKEAVCNVYYSKSRHHHECSVEIQVQNGNGHFKASAQSNDFYVASDLAAEKLSKQFKKMKEKLQHHKGQSTAITLPHKKTA